MFGGGNIYTLARWLAVGSAARSGAIEGVQNLSFGAGYEVGRTASSLSSGANTVKWGAIGILGLGALVAFSVIKKAL